MVHGTSSLACATDHRREVGRIPRGHGPCRTPTEKELRTPPPHCLASILSWTLFQKQPVLDDHGLMQRAAARSRSRPVEARSSGIRPDPDIVGHRHTLSQSCCTCGRICSQESSRSSFGISSGFGSARSRCSRSASHTQASTGRCSASTCCCRRIPGRRNDRRLNTEALQQAQ